MIRFFHIFRNSLVAIATIALVLPSVPPVLAGERQHYKGHWHCKYEDCRTRDHSDNNNPLNFKRHLKYENRHKAPHTVQRRKNDDSGKWIAAGIIGLAAGAIILNEVNKNRSTHKDKLIGRVTPQLIHDDHGEDFWPNTQSQPYTQTQSRPRIQPWTNAWYRWCAERYRSFNPRTGTYRGSDGFDHFCVVK